MSVELPPDNEDTPRLQAADLLKADALLGMAKDRLARVSLLFSPDSVAARDGETFLNASAQASAYLKAYYALGHPELVKEIEQQQAATRKVEKVAASLSTVAFSTGVLPLLGPSAALVAAAAAYQAVTKLSSVDEGRNRAQDFADQCIDEADSAIGLFTRHAWEAVRKPSWKPKAAQTESLAAPTVGPSGGS